ncbi:MAG: 1-deoxy-D-xylulose-5-phosphate reductoisomerase [Actinobacteria bacterium]|nr:1-deoxy-D-xylulose-5-phosphate reductoisomerase [Actinomycetota bacterium]
MKKVLLLGSTGSIGKQALEVISETQGLEVAGLAAGTSHKQLVEQARAFGVNDVAILDENAGSTVIDELPGASVLSGPGCIRGLIESVECDIVLNAVVGAAGLEATMATLDRGLDLALANKESLVVAGELIMETARQRGIRILPVDSEHSAIFQCIQGQEEGLERIFLTASGGPFFGRSRDQLEKVTRDDALNHPRWKMGSKISIDSATLMNKGLEVIEAHHLFGVGYNEIDVLVHPQSVVHSLARFRDGSVLAQMGLPSMKLPIAYALNYPDRLPVVMPQLDLIEQGELTFFKPDLNAFPCLEIAIEAGRSGGGAPIAVNAANEIAVAAFLEGRIRFLDIPAVIEKTLAAMDGELASAISGLEDITEIDTAARRQAEAFTT